MTDGQLTKVVNHIRQAVLAETDAQLLTRFKVDRSEIAFQNLLVRHGPMVFGVCRRWLEQVQDAEDAFQAVFLVLARKAVRSILPTRSAAGSMERLCGRRGKPSIGAIGNGTEKTASRNPERSRIEFSRSRSTGCRCWMRN